MRTLSNNAAVGIAVLVLVLAGVSSAFALSVFDIEYPVPELGNCADKDTCKAYCSESAHAEACTGFAEKYGLSRDPSEKKDFKRFAEAVEADGGPDGKCGNAEDPIRACETVCNEQANMKVCIEYALERNLMPENEAVQSRKVLQALDRGIKPPCENEKTCHEKCENPKDIQTARACFVFAKEAGLLPDDVDAARAERMFELMEKGEIQFRSPREFEKCENPEDDATLQSCIEIGIKLGVVSSEEAEMIKKTGGKGPGGCRGKQCEKFCEDPANEEACFKFAEEHSLFTAEDRARMEEGATKMREGLEKAPPEVAECLKATVGVEVLEGIRNGTKRPSRDLGEKMRTCFEKQMRGNPGGPNGFPPKVRECLESNGVDVENLESEPPRDIMEGCMREFGMPESGFGMPPEIEACFKEKGIDVASLREGPPPPEAQECFARMGATRREGSGPPEGYPRPQGCSSPEECHALCEKNPDACRGFGTPQDGSREFRLLPPEEPRDEFQRQYEARFKEEYERQYQEQFEQQFEEQYNQSQREPGGAYPYPGGQFPPQGENFGSFPVPQREPYPQPLQGGYPVNVGPAPQGFPGEQFQGGTYPTNSGPNPEVFPMNPPPTGGESGPPPQSRLNPPTLLGFFAQVFLGILR